MRKTLTATIWREDDGFVSLCTELDIASQGETVEEARANLREAVELFFETAHPNEIAERLNAEVYITPLEVEIGQAA
jgi:predicted RNase H-like HicB family nuclease